MPKEIIQKEVNIKKKQDEVRGEAKVVVMKGGKTCPDVLACSIYDTNPVVTGASVHAPRQRNSRYVQIDG